MSQGHTYPASAQLSIGHEQPGLGQGPGMGPGMGLGDPLGQHLEEGFCLEDT